MSKKKAPVVCSVCEEKKDASEFSKAQLSKGDDRKCKECVDAKSAEPKAAPKAAAPPKSAESDKGDQKKGQKKGAAAAKTFECSSCHFSKEKSEFSASQLAKNEERRCKVCVEAGGADPAPKDGKKKKKKEPEFQCSECGDDLPASEFSKSQMNKGKDRKCKECVEFGSGGGGGRGGMFGDDDDDGMMMPDLSDRPDLQKLLQKLMGMDPDSWMDTLEEMLENEEISEDGLQQVMMVLAQMDDGEEGEDEGDEGESMSADQDDVIESLGLEVNVAVLHDFRKEAELLSTLSLEMPRSQRAKVINKHCEQVLELKRERLIALNPRMYANAFPAQDEEILSDSDEEEHLLRLHKLSATKTESASWKVDPALLKQAELLAERGALAEDLVRVGARRQDDFAQLILWSRGRRFDGGLKEDPPIVRFAAEGNVEMVKALLMSGVWVDSCASWTHHTMIYDSETPLVAAARCGHAELAEVLVRCGADPLHTCFDRVAFFAEKQKEKEQKEKEEKEKEEKEKEEKSGKSGKSGKKDNKQKKEEEKKEENPFSFAPPSFAFVKLEPDEDTAAILAKRNKHDALCDMLLRAGVEFQKRADAVKAEVLARKAAREEEQRRAEEAKKPKQKPKAKK